MLATLIEINIVQSKEKIINFENILSEYNINSLSVENLLNILSELPELNTNLKKKVYYLASTLQYTCSISPMSLALLLCDDIPCELVNQTLQKFLAEAPKPARLIFTSYPNLIATRTCLYFLKTLMRAQ